jgi:hypothetical protein
MKKPIYLTIANDIEKKYLIMIILKMKDYLLKEI